MAARVGNPEITRSAYLKVSVARCRMAKNKRIKKNWSDEDVQILIWVISKYCDSRRYADVEKDMVNQVISRIRRIGL